MIILELSISKNVGWEKYQVVGHICNRTTGSTVFVLLARRSNGTIEHRNAFLANFLFHLTKSNPGQSKSLYHPNKVSCQRKVRPGLDSSRITVSSRQVHHSIRAMLFSRTFFVSAFAAQTLFLAPIQAQVDVVTDLVCGVTGAANFLTTAELQAAVQCATSGLNCDSQALPLLARTSILTDGLGGVLGGVVGGVLDPVTGLIDGLLDNLLGFYGNDIGSWCTGLITNFDGIFANTVRQLNLEQRAGPCFIACAHFCPPIFSALQLPAQLGHYGGTELCGPFSECDHVQPTLGLP